MPVLNGLKLKRLHAVVNICFVTLKLLTRFCYMFISMTFSKPGIGQVIGNFDRGFSFERNCVLRRWESESIHSDEGLTLETLVFESFTVANLPYQPCG